MFQEKKITLGFILQEKPLDVLQSPSAVPPLVTVQTERPALGSGSWPEAQGCGPPLKDQEFSEVGKLDFHLFLLLSTFWQTFRYIDKFLSHKRD